ncbi:Squamosa promoter-binding-like protein [Quillaja saponaria]|uniref:Squamosa promoter-binding-like protein n=1 Tax=Quillaja saponaria TaxID=32244 RepID=A0AAD7KQW8_QUISA|nr:Squamosa promoter-binding-like protein [Quillaja saponaria]
MAKRSIFNGEEEEETEEKKKAVKIRIVYGQKGLWALWLPSASSGSSLCCQVDECGVDLQMAKKYHQKHKVCERHTKASVVLVRGVRRRFCQQCSRFHEISHFDDTKSKL